MARLEGSLGAVDDVSALIERHRYAMGCLIFSEVFGAFPDSPQQGGLGDALANLVTLWHERWWNAVSQERDESVPKILLARARGLADSLSSEAMRVYGALRQELTGTLRLDPPNLRDNFSVERWKRTFGLAGSYYSIIWMNSVMRKELTPALYDCCMEAISVATQGWDVSHLTRCGRRVDEVLELLKAQAGASQDKQAIVERYRDALGIWMFEELFGTECPEAEMHRVGPQLGALVLQWHLRWFVEDIAAG